MAIERLIGIDFGTSTSVVKSKRYDVKKVGDKEIAEPVGNAHHADIVAFGHGVSDAKALSLVRINADGTVDCGTDEMLEGATLYREFKMALESDDEKEKEQARELTYRFLKYLYDRYSHQESDLGEKGDKVSTIISFPAKWKSETREFMMRAVSDVGFDNVSSMDEPTAALFAVMARKIDEIRDGGLLKKGEDNLILVVDMGAGTTDLSVCRCTVNSEGTSVKATDISNELILSWPEDGVNLTFGGREVDEKLKAFLSDYLLSCNLPQELAKSYLDVNSGVKAWKEKTLSPSLEKGESVQSCAAINPMMFYPGVNKKPFPEITRESFEKIIEDKIEDFKELINGCLDKLDDGSEIDVVILTGGHSSWYFAKELLDGTMQGIDHPALRKVREEKQRVKRLSNPQETVALGMVYSKLPFRIKSPAPLSRIEEKLAATFENYPVSSNIEALKKNLKISPDANIFFAQDCSAANDGTAGTIITGEGLIYATDKKGIYVNRTRISTFAKGRVEMTENNIICNIGSTKTILFGESNPVVFDILSALHNNLNDGAESELTELEEILISTFETCQLPSNLEELKRNLKIYSDTTVYFAGVCASDFNKMTGMIATKEGIFANSRNKDGIHFIKWELFANSSLERSEGTLIAKSKFGQLVIYDAADQNVLDLFKVLQSKFKQAKLFAVKADATNDLKQKAKTYLELNVEKGKLLSTGGKAALEKNLKIYGNVKEYCWKDDALFFNGSKGFILTEDGFSYINGLLSEPCHVEWKTFCDETQTMIAISADKAHLDFYVKRKGKYTVWFGNNTNQAYEYFSGLQNALK